MTSQAGASTHHASGIQQRPGVLRSGHIALVDAHRDVVVVGNTAKQLLCSGLMRGPAAQQGMQGLGRGPQLSARLHRAAIICLSGQPLHHEAPQ